MNLTHDATAVLLGTNVDVAIELGYDTDDPWAVTFTAAGQRWIFARDLLASGCTEPVGDGDVRIRPDTGGDFAHVVIALRSPTGAAELAVPRATVEKLLDAAEALVPAGYESIDWAAEWARLAGPAAA